MLNAAAITFFPAASRDLRDACATRSAAIIATTERPFTRGAFFMPADAYVHAGAATAPGAPAPRATASA